MRPSRDAWAMELAVTTAARTTCLRRAVGCVLLSARGHVLATGYNGVAAGLPHCNDSQADLKSFVERNGMQASWEDHEVPTHPHACSGALAPSGTNLDGCQAIHAEQNALLQCQDVYAIDTCYVTTSPCVTCVKLLLNTGCRRIVFLTAYPHTQARQLWEAAGRVWEQLQEEPLAFGKL